MSTTRNALSLVAASEGENILVITDLLTVKVQSEDTKGMYAVTEVSTPPQGGPPGLHRHPSQETFYILEGTVRFDTMQDGQPHSLEVTPGSVVHIPSMTWHNYKNIGATPSKMLAILQPGDMLDFFRELGIPVTDKTNLPRPSGPPDMQRVKAITQKHHVEMMGPPPQK